MTTEKGRKIAQSSTTEIFAWGSDRTLKLFYDRLPRELVEHELLATRTARGNNLKQDNCEVSLGGKRNEEESDLVNGHLLNSNYPRDLRAQLNLQLEELEWQSVRFSG